MDKEKRILSILADYEKDGEPITREQAEEIAEWEIKAEKNRNYVSTEKGKKERARKIKIDEDKVNLIEILNNALTDKDIQSTIKNNQREIIFQYKDFSYSVILTKHRK